MKKSWERHANGEIFFATLKWPYVGVAEIPFKPGESYETTAREYFENIFGKLPVGTEILIDRETSK